MARIAGLDAEEATNRLTAAIRGFGMELDQESAQRVADVYSELAAISASDTDELSTAMSKTASIANSAGASFENTSAFLAMMIESTREQADAIGTSLKTVVARFSELKNSPNEIGEVDGEVVDANAIETALRSVGIALRDEVTGQFRDFDDIIMELAEKWDTLDRNTQRYIGTVAAGSRLSI